MAGMQFEYDEQGGTFYYFLLSFVALVLLPATYYLWPSKSSKDDGQQKHQCQCEPCQLKRQMVRASQPWKVFQNRAIKFIILSGWVFFVFVAYKASKVEIDFKEFDPYAELGIDRGAELAEIKKAYRKLSLIYHPDRETGDSNKFMYITKAYDALTDEESRKNWEEYGNPDGPGATQVGIALPKWIVEKQNSIWVLGLYALIFMIILPLCVGMWWYHSIKYSAQQVLIDTTKLYRHFLRKSPNMIAKRVIQVLAASCEFSKRVNSEIVERPSDNVEIPELIRGMPGFNQNSRDIFSSPYCVKARALLEAHFSRKELPAKTLEIDRQYVLKKCPYLLNELLSQAQWMLYCAQADPQVSWKLSLDTVENIMKTCQMVIQGIWSQKSVFLQLPHITEDILRHFVTKRRNIRTLKQFVCLKEEDRRALLRSLNEDEYRDVMVVCSMLPNVEMNICCEVKGEEDQTISASSLVTLTVTLMRQNLMTTELDIDDVTAENPADEETYPTDQPEEEEDEEQQAEASAHHKASAPPPPKWMKSKKKKGPAKKPKKPATKLVAPPVVKKPLALTSGPVEEKKEPVSNHSSRVGVSSTEESNSTRAPPVKEHKSGGGGGEEINLSSNEESDDGADDENVGDGDSEAEGGEKGEEPTAVEKNGDEEGNIDTIDDEEQWKAFQRESKNDNILETKSKETHLVHCPHFPVEKFEWWWLYLADTKKKQLVAPPLLITTLRDTEKKELRFQAPPKPGHYQYTVVLRSDSYLGIDQTVNVKLDVKEAKKVVETHPQWENMTDDEEEKKDQPETESDTSDSENSQDDE